MAHCLRNENPRRMTEWHTMRKGERDRCTIQRTKAIALARRAGLPTEGPYNLLDAPRIQAVINGFRLCIWQLQGGIPTLIYKGDMDTHTVHVVMHQHHVDLALSMPALL